MSIAQARALPDGATAEIEGVLTTGLGSLEADRTGFVQDLSGGIALYLDAAYPVPLPAGTVVRATGTVGSRYGQRTLRVVGTDVLVITEAGLPAPLDIATGGAGEPVEGFRVRVEGVVTETPSALADGLGVTIDDGSGPVRVIAGPQALGSAAVAKGDMVTAIGPLGQRDSSGTGIGGYRVYATLPGEFAATPPAPTPTPPPSESATPSATATVAPSDSPAPSPSATPSPSASASSSPAPTGTPVPSATPLASPTAIPSASPITIAAARALPVGATAAVEGVVTAEAGRIGTPALFVIADATGGLPVRLDDAMTPPARGTRVSVRGAIAAPYGQTELRLEAGALVVVGSGTVPVAQTVAVAAIGEGLEGRLVTVAGTVTTGAAKATSGDIVLVITGAGGATLKLYADATAGIDAATLKKGVAGTFTGIVGQHASHKGALDGYRVWLRDDNDIHAAATPTPTPSATPTATASAVPASEPIATARLKDGATVTVTGIVTAPTSLLDTSGRRTVIQDATGAIELYLAAPNATMHTGARLRVTGTVGRAWGAPRLHAETITALGTATPAVLDLRVAPGAATEWRLVRVTGTVKSVHKSGDRWVAELDAGSFAVPITALAGADIPATAINEGRTATITGIVKRPYPTASDRRYAVLPRSSADVVPGPAGAGASASPSETIVSGTGPAASPGTSGAPGDTPTADLRDLASRVGQRVRVSGLVTELSADGFRLDDGTATAAIVLGGSAADLATLVAPGDALDAIGTVELRDGPVLVVRDPADVTLVGDLGGADPSSSPGALLALALGSSGPETGLVASPPGGSGTSSAPAFGMLAAALATIAAVLAVAARRVRVRHADRARINRRLAVWAGTAPSAGASQTATQGASEA